MEADVDLRERIMVTLERRVWWSEEGKAFKVKSRFPNLRVGINKIKG